MFEFASAHTRSFIVFVETMRKKSGLPYTIKYMKAVRLHITRYISGHPLKSNSSGVSLTKDGFPKRFLYLKDYIDTKGKMGIRYVLSLTNYTRSIIPTKRELDMVEPDFSTITNPYKGKKYTIPLKFIKDFVKKYRLQEFSMPNWDSDLHYLSNKKSPFGKATLTASYGLLYCVENCQWLLQKFVDILGQDQYEGLIGNFIQKVYKDHRLTYMGNPLNGIGKLSIVNDPELKLRIIAQVDYYSQLLLKPIHEKVLKKLSNLPQDRTFTQDPRNKWSPNGSNFWSLDLSAATDRFPIDLQEKFMSVMFKPHFAPLWRELLTKRVYTYKDKSYMYSVGQPMGAYSSWAVFTMTHHLVVQWAAHLCGREDFTDYILLGDDIVIRDDAVARRYKKIMFKLGVDISEAKSHVSKNTYEFAKRWFRNGVEVSGLPLRGILCNIGNPLLVLKQVMDYTYRNTNNFRGTALVLVSKLYQNIKINKRYYTYHSMIKMLGKFYIVLRYAYGHVTNSELREFLLYNIPNDDIKVPCENLVPSLVREILVQGINSSVEKAGSQVFGFYNQFIDHYKREYGDDFDTYQLADHPILNGLYNKMKSMKRHLMNIRNDPKMDLIEAVNHMRIEDVDKIVQIHRDTGKTVIAMDKLWRESFRSLSQITETNHMNYQFLSLLCTTSPLENFYIDSLSTSLDKMESLKMGPPSQSAQQMLFM